MYKHKTVFFFLITFLLIGMFLISCSEVDERKEEDMGEPQYGGVLVLAYGAQPADMDHHMGTSGQAGLDCGEQMVEYLFDWDGNLVPQPGLAESHSVSEDGLVHTVKLRKGVLFHNGKEMTAEDVVASIERWLANMPTRPELAEFLETLVEVDDYTVEFRLHRPTADFLWFISSLTRAHIIPKELCEKYPKEHIPAEEIIGTGPYKMKEFVYDRYVHMVRFEDYSYREEEPDGWFGRKYAYADEIIIRIVPDQSVRTMGVESGEFHYAQGINYGAMETINAHPEMAAVPVKPSAGHLFGINCAAWPTSNVKIRQAMLAAADFDEILQGAYTFPELYRIDSSYMPEESIWHTTAGSQYHNQKDPERSRQLLEEAGYDGEPIVIIAMTEYEFHITSTLIFAKQLEAAGFNVDVQTMDQGTWIARYLNPDGGWHLGFFTSVGSIQGTPTMLGWTRDRHIGWWEGETPEKKELSAQLRYETDFEKRYEIWEKLNELALEEARSITSGYVAYVAAVRDKDSGGWFDTTFQFKDARFWNIWVKQ